MNSGEDIDQLQLLEEKIDKLIGLITALKMEKEGFTEKFQIQEEKLSDLNKQVERLKAGRDKAKQRIISLLERIEEIHL